jgi:hypothetical protein
VLVEREAFDMALNWRRQMDKRSTDAGREKGQEEVHGSTEPGDFVRVGSQGKQGGSGRVARDSSHDSVSLKLGKAHVA